MQASYGSNQDITTVLLSNHRLFLNVFLVLDLGDQLFSLLTLLGNEIAYAKVGQHYSLCLKQIVEQVKVG